MFVIFPRFYPKSWKAGSRVVVLRRRARDGGAASWMVLPSCFFEFFTVFFFRVFFSFFCELFVQVNSLMHCYIWSPHFGCVEVGGGGVVGGVVGEVGGGEGKWGGSLVPTQWSLSNLIFHLTRIVQKTFDVLKLKNFRKGNSWLIASIVFQCSFLFRSPTHPPESWIRFVTCYIHIWSRIETFHPSSPDMND